MAGPSPRSPLPPYLGSWALASLAFTSPIVLSLLLVILRLILAIDSAKSSVASAKLQLSSSCSGLEQSASTAISFPHYLAANVNNATADGAEAIVHGLGTVLDMSVLGIEQLIIFILDTYRSMYLCLAELVVRGSMALAIGATQEFSDFLTTTFSGIRTELQEAISGANTAINTVVNTINDLPGVNIAPPALNISLDSLNNVTVPSDFLNALTSLNNSLPTLDELQAKMDSFVSIPFEDLRSEINGSLKNATIDRSLLPVPLKQNVAFCDELDLSFVDNVGHSLVKVAQYGIIAICVFILLYIGAMVLVERSWYTSRLHYVNASRETWATDMGLVDSHAYHTGGIGRADVDRVLSTHTLLGFIAASNNAFTRSVLPWFISRIPPLRRSPRARSNVTWFVAYVTHLPALLLLAVAVLGLLSVEVQLAALKPTEATAQTQVNQGLAQFKDTILSKINNATYEQSAEYSNKTNTVLLGLQNGINNDMFGWVDTTTVTLNSSMNEFYTDLTSAINSTFSGTVFASPAQEVIYCLLGSKVEGISKALTWLHDNAQVSLPLVKDDIFALSDDNSNELVSSLDGGKGQQDRTSSSIVRTLVDQYRRALEKEKLVFLFMLGLYGLVVLFGLLALLWHEVVAPRWGKRRGGPDLKELTLEKIATVQLATSRNNQASVKLALPARLSGGITSLLHRFHGHGKVASSSSDMEVQRDNMASFTFPSRPCTQSGDVEKPFSLRAFSPPPAYPKANESTASLLGRMHTPVPPIPSRQGTPTLSPSYPPSSALQHVSRASKASIARQPSAPELPLPYLYRDDSFESVPTHSRSIPLHRLSTAARHSHNPFSTPFDGPSGS